MNVHVLFRVLLLPLVLVMSLMAGCSSTPEETTDTSKPADVVPGCEDAQSPQDCRIQHKKGGSDVPTVDNVLETKP
ncbi:MAG: hypothetical protein HPY82_04150 [Gammaproteobacteria bacterium]|nr:hypothetical protein [Gammaproteobacteria bacterium]